MHDDEGGDNGSGRGWWWSNGGGLMAIPLSLVFYETTVDIR